MVTEHEGVSFFCGIGERNREAEELYRDMQEAGVLESTVMVFGQMNEPPGARFRVGHAALTMAEYFRDDVQQDVLLLIRLVIYPLRWFYLGNGRVRDCIRRWICCNRGLRC
ncbi:MAG: hypothetical protein RH949_30165 [Coleofasciculus sp. A1-SPW-01]